MSRIKSWFLNVRRQQLCCLADGSKKWHLTFLRATSRRQSEDTVNLVIGGHITLTLTQPEESKATRTWVEPITL